MWGQELGTHPGLGLAKGKAGAMKKQSPRKYTWNAAVISKPEKNGSQKKKPMEELLRGSAKPPPRVDKPKTWKTRALTEDTCLNENLQEEVVAEVAR